MGRVLIGLLSVVFVAGAIAVAAFVAASVAFVALFAGAVGFTLFLIWIAATGVPDARRGRSKVGAWALAALAVVGTLAVGIAVFAQRPRSPGPGWVRAGSVAEIRGAPDGVVYLAQQRLFVVSASPWPLALSSVNPHLGEQVLFCRSSRWFVSFGDGSMFDRSGNYALGPAPRGLDGVGLKVVNGIVWVNPSRITSGSPRGEPKAEPVVGPFCTAGASSTPGFLAMNVFHYRAEFEETPAPIGIRERCRSGMVPAERPSDESEVAHHGWALEVLNEIAAP